MFYPLLDGTLFGKKRKDQKLSDPLSACGVLFRSVYPRHGSQSLSCSNFSTHVDIYGPYPFNHSSQRESFMNLMSFNRILCFLAHPDDETLGAGGTISKLTSEGKEVFVAIPATGIYSRNPDASEAPALIEKLQSDAKMAIGHLGVKEENISFGEFPDNAMDSVPLLDVIQWLENLINKIKARSPNYAP